MNLNLLYRDREWGSAAPYRDWLSITKDLELNSLFKAAETENVVRNKRIATPDDGDPYLGQAVKRVMAVPLKTAEEIKYRQDILKDCFTKQGMVDELYRISTRVLSEWDRLGRKNNAAGEVGTKGKLITDIKVFKLLVDGMRDVKKTVLLNRAGLESEGWQGLCERLENEFSDERQTNLYIFLDSMSFYSDIYENERKRNEYLVRIPKMRLECGLSNGLKVGDFRIDSLESKAIEYDRQFGMGNKIADRITSFAPGVISLRNDQALKEDAEKLEFAVVSYVYSFCTDLVADFGSFFDQLHFQMGFYLGAINIRSQMVRFNIDYCYPETDEENRLRYEELRELILSFSLNGRTVANTGRLDDKQLVIITGANQGGKSTFLRSLGVAQVMMQCGLIVAAKRYRSPIQTSIYTHFTRREESAMNSGRLDEELRRMDRIVNGLTKGSLVLLNESFATTTEKDGSAIAYGIVKALKEAGVKIYTVTHLLSFAQQMYEETKDDESVVFLSAEHLDDGKRTFKMIPHAPELTSFGLELYDRVLGEDESK